MTVDAYTDFPGNSGNNNANSYQQIANLDTGYYYYYHANSYNGYGLAAYSTSYPIVLPPGRYELYSNAYDSGGAYASEDGSAYQYAYSSMRISSFVPTPEPANLTLLGLGLAGLAGYGWRRRPP